MNNYVYILIMAVVTYAIRVLPLTLIKGQIKNRFLQSFLYYVPYVTLSVMTFPAIVHATQSTASGIAALIVGIIVAWIGFDLFKTAVSCCLIVFILELFL
ncbi:MAG: AzlD domain-containing protein [Lachnospiraceae bacterium]|nr:AzlD domain-containing protein [Lachnospiraceae bacterium]